MALITDLENKVTHYLRTPYDLKKGNRIPNLEDPHLTHDNTGIECTLCFLYVDIRNSSALNKTHGVKKAAQLYKIFHEICVKVIESNNGQVRAFDGDRVMGVFAGNLMCGEATISGRKILWAIEHILNKKAGSMIRIGCGVDFGETLISKVGKGKNQHTNDLVWIGEACNMAAHLCQRGDNEIYISRKTFENINKLPANPYPDLKTGWQYKQFHIKNEPVYSYINKHALAL